MMRDEIFNIFRWQQRQESVKHFADRATLIAALEQKALDIVVPIARELNHTVRVVTSHESALELAFSSRFGLVITTVAENLGSLSQMTQALRSSGCASRDCSLLVLVERSHRRQARQLVGRGVNAVLVSHSKPELIADATARLMRRTRRKQADHDITAELSYSGILRPARCHLVNLSTSGALLESPTMPRLGSTCRVRLSVKDTSSNVNLRSWVVRRAETHTQSMVSFAVEFLPMSGHAQIQLNQILDNTPDQSLPRT